MIEAIGIGCRYAGNVGGPRDLWTRMQSRDTAIGEVPEHRLKKEDFLGIAREADRAVSSRAGWLDGIDRFDALYFRISPREAAELDPQQRLALEVAHEAIFDANVNPERLAGRRVGVFVGASLSEYQAMAFSNPADTTRHTMSGSALSVIANRISYSLDLQGPSITLDTACSSALTALHLACQSLRAGECDLALVLGVNALVGPFPFLGFARAQMLSPTGRCSPFDARADGFVRGEGCGAVLLGSSERPIQPLRRVYARVVGSTINEDGKTASLTMPSGERQVELLQTLRDGAGVRPERIVYVEAHGTGTPVGDPIEARSISAAVLGARQGTLCIGSAKGHFGHLEAGAGIVGFMRAALCAYHRRLVPTAGFESWNPDIDARALALRVPTEVEPLPSPEDGGAAFLAVCSYGFGGANASALLCPPGDKLASPKDETPAGNGADFVVLPLSAHHEPALEEMSGELARRPAAERRETVRWTGACLPGGRYRRAFVGRPGDGFPRGAWSVHGDAGDAPRRIAFCYAGQGSQHREMSVALYRRFPVYRDAIETADRLFAGHAGYSLLEDHGFCGRGIDDEAQLDVRMALPAIVFAQVALTQLLRHFGIEPAAVMGHSTGEMVAAWACGALSLDDLCLLTGVRARLQHKMREGRMAAWASSAEQAAATLAELDIADRVVIGAHNAPEALTLSGDVEAIASAIEHGKKAGVRCTELAVKRAYHSPHVADILDELRERLASLQPGRWRLPFISTVSGFDAPDAERRLDADYWVENVARPVDFLSGCRALGEQVQAVVEISPRPVLAGYLAENVDCPVVSPLHGRLAEDEALARGLAKLFVRGVSVDWSAVDPPKRFVRALRVPWQHDTAYRSAFWKTPALQADGALGAGPGGLNISRSAHGFLADHVVENRVVMPAAGFVALAASAGKAGEIADIEFDRFLPLWDSGDRTALKIDRDATGRWSCATDGGRHAQVTLHGEHPGRHVAPAPEVDLAACMENCQVKGNVDRLYAAYSRHSGLHLGSAFQSVREIAFGDAQALGVVRSPPHVRGEFARRTVTLDGCFQVLAFLSGCDSDFVVPTAIGAVHLSDGQLPTGQLLCHASLSALGRDNLTGDLSVWSDGRPVMQVRDLRLVRMPSSASRNPSLYALEYQARGLPRTAPVREPAGAPEQLRDILASREASRVLRILDRSADGWLDDLARDEPDLFPPGRVFIAAERGAAPDAPDCVHGIDDTAALRPGSFDVVLGRDEGGWAVANGAAVPLDAAGTDTGKPDRETGATGTDTPGPEAATPQPGTDAPGAEAVTKQISAATADPDAASPETGLAVCTLGEEAWGWTGARSVAAAADASLVVDFRDSLVSASATLRGLLEAGATPAVVFVVREDPDAMPSAMWGFARAARNENAALDAYVVGVPGSAELSTVGAWLEQLFEHGPGAEFELRRVGNEWRVPRLLELDPPAPTARHADYRLEVARPGQIESLRWRAVNVQFEGLRPHEVRIRVTCVSLHFKDIMLALGMLPGFRPIIGMECAGEIIEVGSAVAEDYPDLRPEAEVLCLSMATDAGESRHGLFATTAIAEARCTLVRPPGFSDAEAAGFLGVYSTAWYALHDIARVEAGETVLIHSAAGGVGMAAVQVARSLGATVLASAGTEEKRAWLRDEFGIDCVLDSRRPDTFVEATRERTGGRGVNVVLNSLSGDGLVESLRCLAASGRHVEIGKRDIMQDTPLGLAGLQNNISFLSVHLDMLDETHPERLRELAETCCGRLVSGEAEPIPGVCFPAREAVEAFRLMSSGRHRGKVTVTIPPGFNPGAQGNGARSVTAVEPIPQALFSAAETQLITGGTGGLGLALARLLAARGAGRVILASRRGAAGRRIQLALAGLRRDHPHCEFAPIHADVTDENDLKELLSGEPGITGIFHAATDYRAQSTAEVHDEDLVTFATKAGAAWRLHRATVERPVRHFVLITSLAGLHGNANQAVYVAANAALHELARLRRTCGLPGVAIDFPAMLGVGRLSEPQHVEELDINVDRGFEAVSYSRIEPWLERVLAQPGDVPPVISLDCPSWPGYLRLNRQRTLFEHLAVRSALSRGARGAGGPVIDLDAVTAHVRSKVAFLLGAAAEDIDPDIPLTHLGVDSLAALELVAWADAQYGVGVSQTEFLSGITSGGLIEKIVELSARGAGPREDAASAQRPDDAPGATHAGDAARLPAESPADGSRATATDIPGDAGAAASAEVPPSPPATPDGSGLRADAPTARDGVEDGFQDVEFVAAPGVEAGRIEIEVPEFITGAFIEELLGAMRASARVLVLRGSGTSESFCLGANLEESAFGSGDLSEALEKFAELSTALGDARMPVVAVVEGACRGGGMLFPSLATYVLATGEASFGFPEIRRGGLPGVVSVAARRRLTEAACQRYMLSGDAIGAEKAAALGLVDFLGSEEDVERELQRILGRFAAVDPKLLAAGKAACPASSIDEALLTMGALGAGGDAPARAGPPLVRLRHKPSSGVLVVELNDPEHGNAIDSAIADDLGRAVDTARTLPDVRCVVFQGTGPHFCVGVNPYTFIPRTRQLPVLTAASVTRDIYRAFVAIRELGVPVVCVVHGKVMGGGLAAMLNADARICTREATINYGNLPRGVCPGMLLSESLERLVGRRWANELYLNDYTVDADTALEIGLVNQLADDAAAARGAALEMAERIAGYPPLGVRTTVALTRAPVDEARLAAESIGMARCNIRGETFAGAWKAPERRLTLGGRGSAPEPRLGDGSSPRGEPAGERPDRVPDASAGATPRRAADVGIRHMELYHPGYMVEQSDMERFHGAPGKYTAGLGQEAITFCGDNEDAVSMAMTVVRRLMERADIDWSTIGRLEVGTESLLDRSKSIKTHLMRLFEAHGCHDIEGIDTYSACYGGTAALFNTVSWCQSEAWDGRLGLVVCVDIADLNAEQSFLNGAAAVAMLIGPDADLAMEPERGSHMMDTWDFYKPVGWKDSYPLMRDGKHSIDVYMACLDGAQRVLADKLGVDSLLRHDDFFVFHCTSTYLCRRAFDRLVANCEPGGIALKEKMGLYEEKVEPGTRLTRQLGSTYTASCYVNLYSLLLNRYDDIVGKRICVYSFGSGATASMFRLRVRRPPRIDRDSMRRLDRRIRLDPEAFVELTQQYSGAYARFPFEPQCRDHRQADVYYLSRVDEWGQRFYRFGLDEQPVADPVRVDTA